MDYEMRADTGDQSQLHSPTRPIIRPIAYGVNPGSRHTSNDNFHLDLNHRSSSSRNILDSSPSPSQGAMSKNYKIDRYSIPVFFLELIALVALGFLAHLCHYQDQISPMIEGFYCDDINYQHKFFPDVWAKNINDKTDEVIYLILSFLIPLVLILFCELVNSMFGSLKFRKINASCACCQLHSITRRTVRFCGAFVLGYLLTFILADVLRLTTGRLRPYFKDVCESAYVSGCLTSSSASSSSLAPVSDGMISAQQQSLTAGHRWVSLANQRFTDICKNTDTKSLEGLGESWPAFPAAISSYIGLFVVFYLCYVGTARPFRMIISLLIGAIVILCSMFNIFLVKLHYYHWEDVIAGALLALLVVIFVVIVYLNKFRDAHYYENQKLFSKRYYVDDQGRPIDNDKYNQGTLNTNDIPMKYFHIPRANIRGSPRPITSEHTR